jgi:UDP-N-acetylmuramoylalanine--D-glutamate ligase
MDKKGIQKRLHSYIQERRLVLLGLGREGKSSLDFFLQFWPEKPVLVLDQNENLLLEENDKVSLYLGKDYLNHLKSGDYVLKSPGISLKNSKLPDDVQFSSQTDLFLFLFRMQTIGITGTKGKSTTSSLLYHILVEHFSSVFLVGNIGVPALSIISELQEDSLVVYEMSSHQLQFAQHSPHMAALLNLHQEHLDHYTDYQDYRNAKWQISTHQDSDDFFIYNKDNAVLCGDLKGKKIKSNLVSISLHNQLATWLFDGEIRFPQGELYLDIERFKLKGKHNIFNLLVCLAIAEKLGIAAPLGLESAYGFKGLAHRLEYVGKYDGISFYNDSIATIPEACIQALKAVKETQVLILGGFDRGIDYTPLVDFLMDYRALTLVLMGKVGERIKESLVNRNYPGNMVPVYQMEEAVAKSIQACIKGGAVVLSPAAASYDTYKNFEERGEHFTAIVHALNAK